MACQLALIPCTTAVLLFLVLIKVHGGDNVYLGFLFNF